VDEIVLHVDDHQRRRGGCDLLGEVVEQDVTEVLVRHFVPRSSDPSSASVSALSC
jgi:hypothetical protein